MADPRNTVILDGIGYEGETFAYDSSIVYDGTVKGGSVSVGLAVALVAARQVRLAVDADRIEGRLQQVDGDGNCAVQTEGNCQLPGGNGATLTIGKPIVGALNGSSAPGYIRMAAANSDVEARDAAHSILDASVTTAVWVELD